MASKHIHIISFDIPYPANYGGVIDVFNKIKTFAELGTKVHLHCYEYGRERAPQLKKYCSSVNYYPRNVARSKLFNSLPYIVTSRDSVKLLKNLLKDDHPVLMEGLHSCYFLGEKALKGRTLIVRTHNIEHDYYQGLAKVESNIFKRYYFYNESTKLEHFEPALAKATHIAAISPNDTEYYAEKFKSVIHLPPFHPHNRVTSQAGKGDFVLYHGNLGVGENNEAALFLVTKVFKDLRSVSLVIAGSKPSRQLKEEVDKRKNITLQADLPSKEIYTLIKQAHINILPTFQATGIKLKLLTALYSGRHALVNNEMIVNTGLDSLCHIGNTADKMKQLVKKLMEKSFTEEERRTRSDLLKETYSNINNLQNFITQVY